MGGEKIIRDSFFELGRVGSFNPSETSTALGRVILLYSSKLRRVCCSSISSSAFVLKALCPTEVTQWPSYFFDYLIVVRFQQGLIFSFGNNEI